MVRLTDTAKIAGDRCRTIQVDIRAIRAFGIERLDIAGADDLHGSRDGRQIAIQLLLFHFADFDPATGHQAPLGDCTFGSIDHPREVLQGTDFQCDRIIIGEFHLVCPVCPVLYGDIPEH